MTEIDRLPSDLSVQLYTDQDLLKARNRGKLVGWIQGGVAVLLGGMLLQFLGWIPALLVMGVVGYGLFRILFGGKKDPEG